MSAYRYCLVATITLFALGACAAGAVRVQSELNRSTYNYHNFDLYHGNRDTKVVIHGNPFGMDPRAFAAAVTRNMQGANAGPATNFTITPRNAEKNLRVVMAFNTDADGYDLCSRRPVESRPRGHPLTLNAAWCWGNDFQSYVEAGTGTVSGVDDPKFRALVQATVLELFPREVPVREDNGDDERMNP